MTRRALLVVGGVALLAGYSRAHFLGVANTAGTQAAQPMPSPGLAPTRGPAGTPASTTRPASARSASTAADSARSVGAPAAPGRAMADPGGLTADPVLPAGIAPTPARSAQTARWTASRPDKSCVPMVHIDDGPKAIALTIDDGPSRAYTPQILKLLDKYQVTATFSMVGLEVDAFPAVAREVVAAGHQIANHTWSHPNLGYQSPIVIADQISAATCAIHDVTGRVPHLFRAPYGVWSPAVLKYCAQTGMTPLDWSVDPRDWSRPGVSAIVGNILRNTKTGSIILEHDGGGNRSQTVAALKIVLPRLLDAGYHFTTP